MNWKEAEKLLREMDRKEIEWIIEKYLANSELIKKIEAEEKNEAIKELEKLSRS